MFEKPPSMQWLSTLSISRILTQMAAIGSIKLCHIHDQCTSWQVTRAQYQSHLDSSNSFMCGNLDPWGIQAYHYLFQQTVPFLKVNNYLYKYKSLTLSISGRRNAFIDAFSLAHHNSAKSTFLLENLHCTNTKTSKLPFMYSHLYN